MDGRSSSSANVLRSRRSTAARRARSCGGDDPTLPRPDEVARLVHRVTRSRDARCNVAVDRRDGLSRPVAVAVELVRE